jgi:hypothetical protein
MRFLQREKSLIDWGGGMFRFHRIYKLENKNMEIIRFYESKTT